MSVLMCYLARKEKKGFTICEVGTWYGIEIALLKKGKTKREEAKRIYNLFHNGEDKTEKFVTKEELIKLNEHSNGGIYIVTKTKFLHLKDMFKMRGDKIKNKLTEGKLKTNVKILKESKAPVRPPRGPKKR